jgi:DNA-binding MarR family transcriptional regulator
MANVAFGAEFDDQPMGYLLYRVQSVLQPAVNEALSSLGLSLPEFVCLKILAACPGMSNAELARTANVTPQSMYTVLRNLQDVGAVTRPSEVSSGRALPAQLTRAGRALLKRGHAAGVGAEERVMAALTTTQQRELKRLMGLIVTSAGDVLDERNPGQPLTKSSTKPVLSGE